MDDQTVSMMKPVLAGMVRHGIGAAGGALVSAGLLNAGQSGEFTKDATGIAMILGAMAWSFYQKKMATKAAPATPVAPPAK